MSNNDDLLSYCKDMAIDVTEWWSVGASARAYTLDPKLTIEFNGTSDPQIDGSGFAPLRPVNVSFTITDPSTGSTTSLTPPTIGTQTDFGGNLEYAVQTGLDWSEGSSLAFTASDGHNRATIFAILAPGDVWEICHRDRRLGYRCHQHAA